MPISFEHYLSIAFSKWKDYAHHQQHWESQLRTQITNTKYTDHSTFDLADFDGKKFSVKTKLHNTAEGLWENHHVYYFNKNGLPLIGESRHVYNQVFWTSYYLYQLEETVYVSYNNAVSSPDHIVWIEWENGRKKALHFFRFQMGIDTFKDASFAEFYAKARFKDGRFLIWSAEVFNYDEDQKHILTSDYISTIPGYGFYRAKKQYRYDEKGKLSMIVSRDHNDRTQVKYSRPAKGETLASLIGDLSRAFADAIVQALQKEVSDSPVVLLDLSYRSVDSYIPYIHYATEKELQGFKKSSIHERSECFSGILWMPNQLDWNYSEEIEALYTRFFTRIDDTSNWNAGRRFMYALALQINTIAKKKGKPLFSRSFFAYALDYELDYDTAKVLIKCGASAKQVAKWKQEGKL